MDSNGQRQKVGAPHRLDPGRSLPDRVCSRTRSFQGMTFVVTLLIVCLIVFVDPTACFAADTSTDPQPSPLVKLVWDLWTKPFDFKKTSFAILTVAICGTVLICTELARRGKPFYVRPIAGLKAIEEAVGRATEMGKPMLFVPGIVDVNEIDTVAGLTVLATVAKFAAEYDTPLEVPTARALVMTAAREAVQAAALAAGRPDYYNEDRIYYVTDEQFGYVASVCGWMYREKPAACFYLGKFYAESLILAETGNAVSAIQIAGTAETAQLPFFVAACDYTLLGEELFAASAYLSGEPAQLGMLKGQDFGKLAAMVLILVGCALATWDSISPCGTDREGKKLPTRTEWITDTVLKGG